jgi:hypothetical protein
MYMVLPMMRLKTLSWLSWLPSTPKTKNLIWLGDFNILRFFADKNINFHPNRFSDTFNALIQVNELRELYISRGVFTWSNNHVVSILEKLDRILLSAWL